jgi:phosphonopyruvate decarboxylase
MIEASLFYDELTKRGAAFFAGVPDSLLKNFCAYLTDTVPEERHIISANEGGAIGLAAGFHLATGKIPVVYMQNSGIGNAVNPLLSLVDKDVYDIPLILVIGWRGEPDVHDEPQHKKQGKLTLSLLETLGIDYEILSANPPELAAQAERCFSALKNNHNPFAFVVRKDTFAPYTLKNNTENNWPLTREEAIKTIIANAPSGSCFVSTTGFTSRELFELREKENAGHGNDFLTVGSMGHASQIALSVALQKPNKNIFCLDGDGAALMHLGGLTTIGVQNPPNLTHIILNNGAHDSVGGQPTAGFAVDFTLIAKACGYQHIYSAHNNDELISALEKRKRVSGVSLIEIKLRRGARTDLGRPDTTPIENKKTFMDASMTLYGCVNDAFKFRLL